MQFCNRKALPYIRYVFKKDYNIRGVGIQYRAVALEFLIRVVYLKPIFCLENYHCELFGEDFNFN